MTYEVFESFGLVYNDIPSSSRPSPPSSRQSSILLDESKSMDEPDLEQNKLRHEAIEFLLAWGSRIHPENVKLSLESVSQGYEISELLCSLNIDYFSMDFVDRIHADKENSIAGNERRNKIIRQQIRKFYLAKCDYDLENAPLFFASAAEIVEQDEDALLSFMVIINGISMTLKNNSTNVYNQMLQQKSSEFQEYMKQKVNAFFEQLGNADQSNYAEITKQLQKKLKEKNDLVVSLRDRISSLEFEALQDKEELNRYAENNIINQELQRKLAESQQLEKQIREQEELIHKMEVDLNERQSLSELLTRENSSIKHQLDGIREELRDLKDEKANVEHQLETAELRSREFEQRYNRILDASKDMPTRRDYDTLMDRNMKNLKIVEEYEQNKMSLENYRVTLASRQTELEKAKRDYDDLMLRFIKVENANADLKQSLKALNTSALDTSSVRESFAELTQVDDDELNAEFEERDSNAERGDKENEKFAKLQVQVSRLESDKQVVEDELKQQKRYAEKEKKEIMATIAKFRNENEQLTINYETNKNELFKLKSALASLEDKCKRLEKERDTLKVTNATHEQTLKRAAIIISEYVCQNEDGSSANMSGGEILQMKADTKRLEEQLRQKRSQSDAYRHISIEEQRLITTEWYEQASQNLCRKYLTSATVFNGDASRVLPMPDQFNYSTHSHLSDLQNSALSSARSTPTHSGGQPNTSASSTPSSSMTNSVNTDASGVFNQVRSFLGLQRDLQPPRTPARWKESSNAQSLPRPKASPSHVSSRPLL